MRIISYFKRISWRDLATSTVPFVLAFVLILVLALRFLQPAPPTHLAIATGPEDSSFRAAAERYRKILARAGVTLEIVRTEGSQDNLKRLLDGTSKADVGFVQGGLGGGADSERLVSLGSLFYEPLFVFYRGPAKLNSLAELRGRRIAVGPEGSGTRALALALLKANEVDAASAQLLDTSGKAAAAALLARQADAAFMMSDSAAADEIRTLMHAPDVRMFDVAQTDAYLRRFRFLSKLELGAGTFDLGANIPPGPLTLLAPTVELLARPGLHPALSDLLIEAAREVHGRAGLLHKANEFPAPMEHEYPISDDASRYYKSGKALSYRYMPFWLASLVDRILVVVVPALIVLVPALRFIPSIYDWRVHGRIHRRYAELMAVERTTLKEASAEELGRLRARVEEIDHAVINLKIPASFANEVYVLREHIKFVRERLAAEAHAKAAA